MILLLTSESGDQSHVDIVNWLEYYRADYLILTGESILRGDNSISYYKEKIFYNDIDLTKVVNVVFYRRWFYPKSLTISCNKLLNNSIINNLYSEILEIRKLLENKLTSATWIPKGTSISVNKLHVLELAKNVGLNVPETIVTNEKKCLMHFLLKSKNGIITKAIGNYSPLILNNTDSINPIQTKEVNFELVQQCPDCFSVSLFQEKIPKLVELRIFYILGKFFCSAILSQCQEDTKIDSRVINGNDCSKLEPYQLPSYIVNKLTELFNLLDLNTGSVDMILTPDNKYFFLEINPVGQIRGYSRRSGANIEQYIANQLIKIDSTKKNDSN